MKQVFLASATASVGAFAMLPVTVMAAEAVVVNVDNVCPGCQRRTGASGW